MARKILKLALQAAPIAMLAGAGVLALRGLEARSHRSGALQAGHGPRPRSPLQIPLKDWTDILVRTRKEFSDDQIPMIAAGVSFYTLLALFPGLAAFVALYGLFADVAEAQRHLQLLSLVLPGSALGFIGDQMIRLAAAQKGDLSLAFVIGLLASIWSANGAVAALMTGLNIAYEQRENRSFIHKAAISLIFTVGLLVFGVAAIGVLGAGPAVEAYAGQQAALLLNLISWPILFAAMGIGVALLYRFGPSRAPARMQWITWGSAAAMLLWLLVSALFSLYVGAFAHYDKTYGSLGAAVGFMMWTWLANLVILGGAELNAEIAHQTAPGGSPSP